MTHLWAFMYYIRLIYNEICPKQYNNFVLSYATIYDGARYIGKWNGFDVYEPTFADNEPRFIGFPQFIIAKGN